MPRLRDVSTSPSTIALIACTPSGMILIILARDSVDAAENASTASFSEILSKEILMLSSLPSSSPLSSARVLFTIFLASSTLSLATTNSKLAVPGIALSATPPPILTRLTFIALERFLRSLPAIILAFPLPHFIISPEWPPRSPEMLTLHKAPVTDSFAIVTLE